MKEAIIPKEYKWQTSVATYDADFERKLKLSSQMKFQQEIGELHLDECGLPYAVLYEKGMVWVLTRSRSVIYRRPILEEKLLITTWQSQKKGSQYFRCYRFENEQGELLIDACSSFALVDPVTHKLMRPEAFQKLCDAENHEIISTCPPPVKIKPPIDMEPVGRRYIRYSDIDYNGHLNNTVYADLLCDFVPGGMYGRNLREFGLTYTSEAKEGEELQLFAKKEDERFVY